ncbi:MAG TPA: acyl-CoA synthetase [Acidimicrobiales bacterium]|nr:acyl-CoA synthetase [Acidimicrobiales bacterium]
MEFNLADLFEHAVDHFGDREYLVAGDERRTYAEMDARANRLAHHLAAQGVGPGDHVGIYGVNSVEWVETLWAVFKLRAVWININYRYVEDELAYLFGNAHLKALVHDAAFADRVDAVAASLPGLRHRLVIGADPEAEPTGDAVAQRSARRRRRQERETRKGGPRTGRRVSGIPYEAALAEQSPARDFGPRSGDDRYILYTGGTTGMPKGVVWRHEDVLFALGGGIDVLTGDVAQAPGDLVAKGKALGMQITFLPIPPLMHGATQWAVMGQSFQGNTVVLTARFDPHEVWRLVEAEAVNALMITGDAMGRPLVEALDEEPSRGRDLSSILSLSSTAAVFSPSVKDQFLARFPDLVMTDAIGSSEGGANGVTVVEKGKTAMRGGPTVTPVSGTVVLGDDMRPLAPGSGEIGRVARSGYIPLEYLGDADKTAETFVEVDGTRYVVPGDLATVEADGSVTLLGRGSQSINSGGEKIFPEEVEAAVKSHPAVYDALVVGVPDERWGQRVAAVVQPRPGMTPTLESLQSHCRTRIAGYKVPREVRLVTEVHRSPSGKPDYPWAQRVATS